MPSPRFPACTSSFTILTSTPIGAGRTNFTFSVRVTPPREKWPGLESAISSPVEVTSIKVVAQPPWSAPTLLQKGSVTGEIFGDRFKVHGHFPWILRAWWLENLDAERWRGKQLFAQCKSCAAVQIIQYQFKYGASCHAARFNSYTQQICIDDAIIVHEQNDSSESPHHCLPGEFPQDNADAAERDDNILTVEEAPQQVDNALQRPPRTRTEKAKASNVNQTVTYTAHAIDNLADVVDTLNISSSATISYASSHSNGSASFVKENSISESDINFIVSVKVTNELPINPTQLEFRPLDGLEPDQFSEVYGDCFIAGFLEGGAFSAIVSIKVQDKNKISRVKMAAEMQLSATKYFQPLSGAMADSENQDIWTDTELSVSVTWSGGGSIKKPKASWDLPTIIQAANDFPTQVSKYPQRTQAILMSYNSVRSFHEFNAKAPRPFVVLDYPSQSYIPPTFSIYIGTFGNSDNNGISCASSVPDEMNMINKYVSRPSFLPQLGENQGGNFPRVTNTFYSTASSTSPDGQVGLPIPNNTVESSDAVENTITNDTWGQMKPNRSCMPAPRFIASANLSLLSMVYNALLLKCCFRRTKKVKFRTPRESSNQEYPIRQDQVAVMPGATTSP
ncbi:hypothetical protein I7I51_02917 [Histoplasma capsulatum]|uniref:Uncharacterized protein n=1 Tax=Ajellomyces capsulatus TaxID=5037 RepID=A0A8A1MJE5_AJECA|nr:hypothetical protein I7I51_02917 [Histoplasma capsulatum]